MTDRRPERIQSLLSRLGDEGLDALVVSHPPNIRYLTGFSGSAGVLLVCPQGVLFITDFRYDTQSREEIGSLARTEFQSPQFLICGSMRRAEMRGKHSPCLAISANQWRGHHRAEA